MLVDYERGHSWWVMASFIFVYLSGMLELICKNICISFAKFDNVREIVCGDLKSTGFSRVSGDFS